jgi:hypothetical protein
MNPSKNCSRVLRNQTRWAAAFWAALGLWFFFHVLLHYWDGFTQGDLSTWAALVFCVVLIMSSCASWRQKRWAMPLMFVALVVVILFSLDWVLFFTVDVKSSFALAALLFLLALSLYTLALLVITFRSQPAS